MSFNQEELDKYVKELSHFGLFVPDEKYFEPLEEEEIKPRFDFLHYKEYYIYKTYIGMSHLILN